MSERISDEEHNAEIDRLDAIRFRRLIKAGLNNEVWFMRACERQGSEPKSLAEVRGILDYVLVMERTRKGDFSAPSITELVSGPVEYPPHPETVSVNGRLMVPLDLILQQIQVCYQETTYEKHAEHVIWNLNCEFGHLRGRYGAPKDVLPSQDALNPGASNGDETTTS